MHFQAYPDYRILLGPGFRRGGERERGRDSKRVDRVVEEKKVGDEKERARRSERVDGVGERSRDYYRFNNRYIIIR